MRWQGRRESDNVEDRRGQSSGLGGGGGGFRVPRGKGGIAILVVVLVAGYYGIDLSPLLNGGDVSPQTQQQSANISPKDDELAKFTSVVLASTEDNWKEVFQRMGKTYQPPKLVMYRGVTRTSCGTGQAAMGPFYCPGDKTVYIDLSFYQDMKTKLGAGGDFAQAYVVAHEVGHHVQNLLGIEPKVRQMQQGASQAEVNRLSVKMELQADCFAGVWGKYAEKQQMLEEGDLQAALNARAGDRRRPFAAARAGTGGTGQLHPRYFAAALHPGLNRASTAAIRTPAIPSHPVNMPCRSLTPAFFSGLDPRLCYWQCNNLCSSRASGACW
jgi:uncharacterized protein